MGKEFEKILRLHEKEDEKYIFCEEDIITRMMNEFQNAQELLELLSSNSAHAVDFFTMSEFPSRWPVIPIRKSDKFYIKKHTSTQKPYFHSHNFYELIYVHRGKCVQHIDSQDSECVLKEKQACIVYPDLVHSLMPSGKDDIILKMVIPKEIFESFSDIIPSQCTEKMRIFDSVTEQAEYFMAKIMEESLYKREFWYSACKSYLGLLLTELCRKKEIADAETLELLEKYFSLNLKTASLSDFAASLGYSSGYAGRMIKEKTGNSFSELLSRYRIESAKKMLETTSLSVENISLEVGYLNPSGFYKQFCALYGMTPKEYRHMFR